MEKHVEYGQKRRGQNSFNPWPFRGLKRGRGILYSLSLLLILLVLFPSADALAQQDLSTSGTHSKDGKVEVATSEKVIYGADDRLDVYQVTDPGLLRLAQGACLAVTYADIQDNGDGTYTLHADPWVAVWDPDPIPLCPDEPFYGQRQVGFCSAFLVGEDILVTAGHCVGSVAPAFSCGNTVFVFNFEQIDADTSPPKVVSEDQVYFCSEIIENGYPDLDYCVLRLDRPVVGHAPLPIRREGDISDGDPLVVVGHPRGLPKKIADGGFAETSHSNGTFFQTKLDTFRGNSGSLVANANDFLIEGIFIGAPNGEFALINDCVRSASFPIDGPGSSVVRTSVFADLIPRVLSPEGNLRLDKERCPCNTTLLAALWDGDLRGSGTFEITAEGSGGDLETVILQETPRGLGIFVGSIETNSGSIVAEDGSLQVSHGETISFRYLDANDGTGNSVSLEEVVEVDCFPPVLTNLELVSLGGTFAEVSFSSDEPVRATVRYGSNCGSLDHATRNDVLSLTPKLTLTDLVPRSITFFIIQATDEAGNSVIADNAGDCFSVSTIDRINFFAESFTDGKHDLESLSILFSPDGSSSSYVACVLPATDYPTDPSGGTILLLNDDDCAQVIVAGTSEVSLYGANSKSLFVGSNGIITLSECDAGLIHSFEDLFNIPRVSALSTDLVPDQNVSWKGTADRVAVTYDGVSHFDGTGNNRFQVEFFFDGTIRLTYLEINAATALVGLSDGGGISPDFMESDLSEYISCLDRPTATPTPTITPTSTPEPTRTQTSAFLNPRSDCNGDGRIDAPDLLILLQDWHEVTGP